jgi:hypothetical protein
MAGNDTSRDTILSDIAVLLNLYIDYGDLDVPTAIEQCLAHYLIAAVPESTADRMIHEALLTVMNKICSTLFYVRHLILVEEDETDRSALEESKLALKRLIAYLDWTTSKERRKCGYDEICFVAIWPWGSMEDHEHPSCMKDEEWRRQGYWDVWGVRPRPLGNHPRYWESIYILASRLEGISQGAVNSAPQNPLSLEAWSQLCHAFP